MAYYWDKMTTIEKYAAFVGALNRDILSIRQEIEKSPDKILRIKSKDLAKKLGPMFESIDEPTIFWGVKYALYPEKIIVDTGREKESKDYLLIFSLES